MKPKRRKWMGWAVRAKGYRGNPSVIIADKKLHQEDLKQFEFIRVEIREVGRES